MGPSASGKMMVMRMTDKERNDGHSKAGKAGNAKDADEKIGDSPATACSGSYRTARTPD